MSEFEVLEHAEHWQPKGNLAEELTFVYAISNSDAFAARIDRGSKNGSSLSLKKVLCKHSASGEEKKLWCIVRKN